MWLSSLYARSGLSADGSPPGSTTLAARDQALAEHPASALTVHDEWNGQAVTLVIQGDIDITTVSILRNCLDHVLARNPGQLIIDLAAVTFLDCAAVRAFADTQHALPPAARWSCARRSPRPSGYSN